MRAARSSIAALLSFVPLAAASAQNPAPAAVEPPLLSGVQIFSASTLSRIADSLPPGPINTHQIARLEGGLSNMIGRRDTSGVPERHEQFGDIFVVQRGRATLRYGGTTEGARSVGPGEHRGGTIRNGSETPLGPGDIVVIPAGVPHQLLLAPGASFVYVTFKVEKR
jgi:mannose-6-phosphate isomerase-like protein (cupin superfamily)